MNMPYATVEPSREEIDQTTGPVVLEFGTSWCGWCRGARPHIAEALGSQPGVRHIKVEDGPGQPLGRSFRVKLWPTLVFLKDGKEVDRVTRPGSAQPLKDALEKIA